jgi:pyruvate formate lyase activating enzyme
MCFVRARIGDQIRLTSYGRSSGFCIDPVEKKPLNHFLPGTPVLSFGTAGCNLACKFCQNWSISKARGWDVLAEEASPELIARVARETGCKSVAFTYNDPIIFHEYAIDAAIACRRFGIKTIAVTSGYVCKDPREEFYRHMDAANVDLKGFTEKFYRELTGGHLQPVLDTLKYLKRETPVWLEIANLIIPGANDSEEDLKKMTRWIAEELGSEVPLHFTAFHPDWKMLDTPPTPLEALKKARRIAIENGLHYVYTGNVFNDEGSSTYCHVCSSRLIGRSSFEVIKWDLTPCGDCPACGTPCAGVFEARPGAWGSKRWPLVLRQFADRRLQRSNR